MACGSGWCADTEQYHQSQTVCQAFAVCCLLQYSYGSVQRNNWPDIGLTHDASAHHTGSQSQHHHHQPVLSPSLSGTGLPDLSEHTGVWENRELVNHTSTPMTNCQRDASWLPQPWQVVLPTASAHKFMQLSVPGTEVLGTAR